MESKDKAGKGSVRRVEIVPAKPREPRVAAERLPETVKVLHRHGKARGKHLDSEKAAEISEMIQRVGAWGGW